VRRVHLDFNTMEAGADAQNADVIVPGDDFAPDWPDSVRLLCARIFDAYEAKQIQGRDRLGALAFDDAPAQVEGIRRILRDAALENWDDLPPTLTQGQLEGQLNELCNSFDQMIELSSDSENAAGRTAELKERLTNLHNWFKQEVRPFALNARIDERAGDRDTSELDVESLRAEYDSLRNQLNELNHRLAQADDAVSAARTEAGSSASEELGQVFTDRAIRYEKDAAIWLFALICSVPMAAAIAFGAFEALRPDAGSRDAHDFAGLGFWLFVLGLLAFGIRVCAQNFRVNRHLATVARSKQSSCSTFPRLVSAVSDEEVRSAVTVSLAQSIFAVEETGMVDGSADHVTLIERAVLPNLPKGS